jgi:phage major head subunit gpT-like protein
MPINTGAIANLLRPGVKAIWGDYDRYPSQWSEIYETLTSDKMTEYEVELKMLGLAGFRPEGAPTPIDNMGQRTVTQYTHKYVGLSFIITRQALVDNLYKTRFPTMVKALKTSMAQTKEILGASTLNNGFNTSFPIGDGKPLFSTTHPIDGGVVANASLVAADLNETSLENAIINIQQSKDAAGLTAMIKPIMLVVPPQLQFVAERLTASAFRVGTANNDINAMYNLGYLPKGYRVNQYLTNPNAWFVLTDAPDGFKHYVREKAEIDVYADFSTDNLMAKAIERYSFGVTNFRAIYGGGVSAPN